MIRGGGGDTTLVTVRDRGVTRRVTSQQTSRANFYFFLRHHTHQPGGVL